MEYAKDEVFSIKYNKKKNKMGIKTEKRNVLVKLLKRNSVVKVITGLTILLSIANFTLIYYFFMVMSKL